MKMRNIVGIAPCRNVGCFFQDFSNDGIAKEKVLCYNF